MNASSVSGITLLLHAWRDGDGQALDRLIPLVYEELRRLAHFLLTHEDSTHILEDKALVNEAYLRLAKLKEVRWQDRGHFFAASAQLMRYILTDYARLRLSLKRGGEVRHVSVNYLENLSSYRDTDLIALNDALKDLEALDKRKSQVVELRFYGGLEINEIAEILKISESTVKREWKLAKVWLLQEMLRDGCCLPEFAAELARP